MSAITFDNFTLDIEEFDAISFIKEDKVPQNYMFYIMRLRGKQKSYPVTDIGYRFTVLMRGKNNQMESSDAILMDPILYMKNLIRAGVEGILVKRSKFADELVKRAMGKYSSERLINMLEDYGDKV